MGKMGSWHNKTEQLLTYPLQPAFEHDRMRRITADYSRLSSRGYCKNLPNEFRSRTGARGEPHRHRYHRPSESFATPAFGHSHPHKESWRINQRRRKGCDASPPIIRGPDGPAPSRR
jgi:hypothetical protein